MWYKHYVRSNFKCSLLFKINNSISKSCNDDLIRTFYVLEKGKSRIGLFKQLTLVKIPQVIKWVFSTSFQTSFTTVDNDWLYRNGYKFKTVCEGSCLFFLESLFWKKLFQSIIIYEVLQRIFTLCKCNYILLGTYFIQF